jgi:hypothetical protein
MLAYITRSLQIYIDMITYVAVKRLAVTPLRMILHVLTVWICVESLTMTMSWSNLRDGKPITRHMLNFEIALPQSTVTKLSFSDKARLRTLVLEMCEQKMSYREIGKVLGLHWTRVG